MEYIAAANPAAILQLIAIVREKFAGALVEMFHHPDAEADQAAAPGIDDITSASHQLHADGFVEAMADRAGAYHPDPAPAMRKHPQPAITLSQEQARLALDWFCYVRDNGHDMSQAEDDLAFSLDLAALGDEPSASTGGEHEEETHS